MEDSLPTLPTLSPDSRHMTPEEINDAVNAYRKALERTLYGWKSSTGLIQRALCSSNFADAQAELFRNGVESISSFIVRCVGVDPNKSPEEMLNALGRGVFFTPSVMETMPRGEGPEKDVHFFKFEPPTNEDEIVTELALHGFVLAQPYYVIEVNKADPAFAEGHFNGSFWKDSQGRWCYLTCNDMTNGEKDVYIHPSRGNFRDTVWVAAVPK